MNMELYSNTNISFQKIFDTFLGVSLGFNYKKYNKTKILSGFVCVSFFCFVVFTIGVLPNSFLSRTRSNGQEEITNAEAGVVERFRENNNDRQLSD